MRTQDEASIVACIPSLRRYARGLVADTARADDLVQDTLERAWSRFSLWQKRGDIRAWMFGIMHNHFIDGVRARSSRPEDSAGDDLPEIPQRASQSDGIEVRDLPPAKRTTTLALAAAHRWRSGRHGLNLGDCLHYACAKYYRVPILATADEFRQTDLETVP